MKEGGDGIAKTIVLESASRRGISKIDRDSNQ